MSFQQQQESEISHQTATNAPSLNYFFLGMALYLTLIVIVGFWPTYFGPVFLGQEAPPEWGVVEAAWTIHLHTAVFMGWMALLVTQTLLVARGKPRVHMRLGKYGVTFGLALIVVGLVVTIAHIQGIVSRGYTWINASIMAWNSLVPILLQFPLLLGLGYFYRSRPDVHKRYMLLATVALVLAANDRIANFIWPGEWTVEIMMGAEISPLWLYDLYSESRIHPATFIGTAIVLLTYFISMLMG